MATLFVIANTVMFAREDAPSFVSSTLYLAAVPIFTALLTGWMLRLGPATVFLFRPLAAWSVVASGSAIALKLITPPSFDRYIDGGAGGLYLAATAGIVFFGCGCSQSLRRRVVTVLLAIGVNVGAVALLNMDGGLWQLSAQLRPLVGRGSSRSDEPQPEIAEDLLWGAQPALIEKARSQLPPHRPGRANVYLIAVAGSGVQALFSREAHEALRVAALRFGSDGRAATLLSNGSADFLQAPLATRANIAAVAQAIGEKADHRQDILFVYLASHGSRNAELETDLPDYRQVQPISSASVSAALQKSGIARQVIVVSACYSGTWIPALANDNTIVLTASARDRTSFGCDDTRRLTLFGEAFLGSLAVNNLSLHDAFEVANRKISAEELREKVTPSLPQAFVGRNMKSLWLGRP